ncbi:MAG: beta-lactamase family protein [Rhizobiaceae bacterium]|nr:beta-lactamase family protein [Rhizobiaceae bacterium]
MTEKNWTSRAVTAEGYVAPGFEAVAAEFERNFTDRQDVGAAFAAVHNGKTVVDIWGGMAAPGRPWQEDTLQVVFSCTKGLVAACMLKLIEQGRLDLHAPVSRYWPEFAQNGKDRVLMRHLLSHRAGLPGIFETLTPADIPDHEKMERLLAAQPLASDPNAFHCYHALTIGWLAGAVLRRIDGRTLGRFFAEEFAAPLGLETWIGLPENEEHRVGTLEIGPGFGPWDAGQTEWQKSDRVLKSVWGNPPLFPVEGELAWNSRAYHAAEIGGAGAITNARSIARYYSCMAMGGEIDDVRVLKPETIALGRSELSRFLDPYILELMAYGVMWAIQTPQRRFGRLPDAFGHSGAGGSIHGAWPSHGMGFSYTMNQMRVDPEDARSRYLLERLEECIART